MPGNSSYRIWRATWIIFTSWIGVTLLGWGLFIWALVTW